MAEWYACCCNECLYMDLNDRNRYDNSEAYCTKWRKYYPMSDKACSKYFVYDESRKSSSSGCYLTTIVCNVLNYSDDCFYLKTLRGFRDTYMKMNPNLLPILYEYDVIGPMISKYINDDKNKKQIANHLLDNYIIPVVTLIENKQYDLAINQYIEMVHKLKQLYQIDITLNIKDETKITGKGYLLKSSSI